MSQPVIRFENVGKLYRLGTVGTGTISHDLRRWWITNVRHMEDPYLKIGETNDRSTKGNSDYVYALKDINLEVQEGDVLGIIGKNGAGKSTLLKLLSRVTAPTTGKIYTRGRIASLLEVGTGFHPELTGRENIYMNGSILGMKKYEIDRKLDEIIDFSGCERYIDTPVKRYSSGMMVRLGFAVAAHLDPEILVVDEVLAVGDAEFQKKAIGKMQDVSKGQGRTVLFVSHNMDSIRTLCNKGVILNNGQVEKTGYIDTIVSSYISDFQNNIRCREWDLDLSKPISFLNIEVVSSNDVSNDIIETSDEIKIIIKYSVREDITNTNIALTLYKDFIPVFHTWDIDNNREIERVRKKGTHITEFSLPQILNSGKYTVRVGSGIPNVTTFQDFNDCIMFEITDTLNDGSRKSFKRGGVIKSNIKWNDKII